MLIAVLGGGCTSSDGTLPWSDRTLRHSLLVGMTVSDQEVAEVGARLELIPQEGDDSALPAFGGSGTRFQRGCGRESAGGAGLAGAAPGGGHRRQGQIRAALKWQGRSAEWREKNFRTLTSVSYLRNGRSGI